MATIREMGAQTNKLLNLYMSFVMGENPLADKTTIEQQGHDRHQARCGQARLHKMMEVMRNANKGLEQERAWQDLEKVRRAFGPAAAASLFDVNDDGTGATEEPMGRVRRGTKRSLEDELKRLLRQKGGCVR